MAKFRLDPNNPPRLSAGTRAALDSMSDDDIERLSSTDPDAVPPSPDLLRAAVVARRVRMLREHLQLSQAAFAEAFRIPVGTLRDWEQGRRRLDAPAEAYLTVIERNPGLVREILNRSPDEVRSPAALEGSAAARVQPAHEPLDPAGPVRRDQDP